MRGPNSALYGRTAIGGAVNVRTGEPTAAKRAGLDLTGGDFDYAKGAARGSGPVGDWGGYFVSASNERNSGFYTGPLDFEVDKTSLFGKLTFVANDKSFGTVSVNRVRSAQSLPTNEPIIGGRFLSDIEPRFDRLSDLNVPGATTGRRKIASPPTTRASSPTRSGWSTWRGSARSSTSSSTPATSPARPSIWPPTRVELGTRWAAASRVSLYANAALYENRFGDFRIESSGGVVDLTGNRLPIAPDRILNGGIEFAPADAWKVRVDVKHVGDVMVDQGNTFELDPYTLLDAAVSWWLNDRIRFTLSAHNLLDEEYYWNGDTSRAESADPGAPRQVLLGASFSFR